MMHLGSIKHLGSASVSEESHVTADLHRGAMASSKVINLKTCRCLQWLCAVMQGQCVLQWWLLCLQVMSVTDVSKPSYGSGSGSNRLLLFKLSDGRISCKAMEHRHCGNLDDTLLPGTKVQGADHTDCLFG